MKKRLCVFDLDGCIIDSSHRYKSMLCEDGIERIDLDYWRSNEHKACRDGYLPAFYSDYLPSVDDAESITLVATARVLNEPDKVFLSHYMPKPDFVISRPAGSNVSGGKLKVSGIKRLLNLRQFSSISEMVVYEDNLAYLSVICREFGLAYSFLCRGIYIPSTQGH